MGYDIRELSTEDELTEALQVFYAAMVGVAPPRGIGVLELIEAGRPLGVFEPAADGGPERIVATAGSFTSSLCVPGGAWLPQSAVTDLGVLPTHTRRGIASAMVHRQLQQAAERGEVVATLRASEATIYERFGYGLATSYAGIQLDRARAGLRPTVPAAEHDVRLVDAASSWDVQARIYAGTTGAGLIGRPAEWWRGLAWSAGRKDTPLYVAVAGPPGAEVGYVRYRPSSTGHWYSATDRSVVVEDLVATTESARLDLLRFLLSIDLLHHVVFTKAPLDHGLEQLITDARAVQTTYVEDETWLRLVDVPAALAARSYAETSTAAGTSVTLEVVDRVLPGNSGRYTITPAGAERSDAEPDLTADVAALATAYLGSTAWWQLARAGRVVEHVPGALAAAEMLFRTRRLPFSGTHF